MTNIKDLKVSFSLYHSTPTLWVLENNLKSKEFQKNDISNHNVAIDNFERNQAFSNEMWALMHQQNRIKKRKKHIRKCCCHYAVRMPKQTIKWNLSFHCSQHSKYLLTKRNKKHIVQTITTFIVSRKNCYRNNLSKMTAVEIEIVIILKITKENS